MSVELGEDKADAYYKMYCHMCVTCFGDILSPLTTSYCNRHKGINFFDAGLANLSSVEPHMPHIDPPADPTEEEKEFLKEFDELLSTKRYRGQCVGRSFIHDMAKLAGKSDHETLARRADFDRARAAADLQQLHWTREKGARGSQAFFENACSALILALQPGEGGATWLINALSAKKRNWSEKKNNRLHQAIADMQNNAEIWAQLGCMHFFFVTLLSPYRALSNADTPTQADLLPIARELKKICLDLKENPKALDELLYKDAGKTQIANFALNVPIAQHFVDNMAYVQKPTHLTTEQFAEYKSAMPKYVKAMATGILTKIHNLCETEEYGNLLSLADDDPIVLGAMSRIQASATAVERFFGRQDAYMRKFTSAKAFTVHGYLIMHRVDDDDEGNAIAMSDLLKGMYDKDPGAVKKLLRSAMRVGEEMRKRWTNREKEDDEYKAETMRQLQEEWAAHKAASLAKLARLHTIGESWEFDERALRAEVTRLQKRGSAPSQHCTSTNAVDFLKARCAATWFLARSISDTYSQDANVSPSICDSQREQHCPRLHLPALPQQVRELQYQGPRRRQRCWGETYGRRAAHAGHLLRQVLGREEREGAGRRTC